MKLTAEDGTEYEFEEMQPDQNTLYMGGTKGTLKPVEKEWPQVYDPSGEGVEGRCKDCGEMCLMMETK